MSGGYKLLLHTICTKKYIRDYLSFIRNIPCIMDFTWIKITTNNIYAIIVTPEKEGFGLDSRYRFIQLNILVMKFQQNIASLYILYRLRISDILALRVERIQDPGSHIVLTRPSK